MLFRNGFRKSTLDMTHPAVKTGYVPDGTFRLPPAPEQPTSETLTRTPKSFRLVNVVDGVVTVTGPLVVLAATVAVICLSESTVNVDAAVPLNATAVASMNPDPLIVTTVPTTPEAGVMLLTPTPTPPPSAVGTRTARATSPSTLKNENPRQRAQAFIIVVPLSLPQ